MDSLEKNKFDYLNNPDPQSQQVKSAQQAFSARLLEKLLNWFENE